MICPICNGTGISISERQPQGKRKERTCPACYGSGEVEEVKTKRPIITIYKPHGVYMSDEVWEKNSLKVVDENIGAWRELANN